MQNTAKWIISTPDGFKVRVQFQPRDEAESVRTKKLLKNLRVEVGPIASEGPLTVDLFFTDRAVAEQKATLTPEQKAADEKPLETDKPA